MTIYEIHEIDERFKKYNFDDIDILVFDDGLFSQFKYFNLIDKHSCKKYFAISPGLLNKDNYQELNNRNIAMWKFKEFKNTCSFMTENQVLEISKKTNCYLSIHGYNHIKFEDIYNKSLNDKIKYLKIFIKYFEEDLDLAVNWFKNKLGYIPESYCFPYNFTCNNLFKYIIQNKYPMITLFFEKGRKKLDFLH